MNEKMAYEQIIAGKLGAIPLPDMADAIWARIEKELDLDMPEDPTPNGGSTPRFPTGGTMIGGLSALFVVVFIAFFLTQKKSTPSNIINSQPAATTAQPQKEIETFPQKGSGGKEPLIDRSLPSTGPASLPLALDSNTLTLQPVQTPVDSAVINQPIAITPLPAPVKTDTVQTTTKKGRGVSGITADDYRIVPKKDSGNKN